LQHIHVGYLTIVRPNGSYQPSY